MSPGRSIRALVLGLAAIAPLASGCADIYGKGNAPPKGALYYPSSIAVLPPIEGAAGRYALVLSANFDLRFSAGWLSVVDLGALAGAEASPGNPASAVVDQVSIPDFGGPIALEGGGPLAEGDTRLAVIGHRGSSLLSIVEVTVSGGRPQLTCGNPDATAGLNTAERRTDCDRPHLYDLSNKANLGFDATVDSLDLVDPYGTAFYTDPLDGTEHLVVGFLSRSTDTTSKILTFLVDRTASAGAGFLIPEHAVSSGLAALGTIAVQPTQAACSASSPEACAVRIAVASRSYGGSADGSVIALLTIDASGPRTSLHSLTTDVSGTELSGIAFSPKGERAYVLNNSPDGLVGLDTTPYVLLHPDAAPTEELSFGVLDVVSTAGRPSGLAYVTRADQDVLALTRFATNDVMVIAAADAALVPASDVGGVGSGPFALDSVAEDDGSTVLVVGTFYDHGITTIRIPAGDVSAAFIDRRVRSSELGDASKQ